MQARPFAHPNLVDFSAKFIEANSNTSQKEDPATCVELQA